MDPAELRINGFLRLGYFVDYSERRYPIDFSNIDRSRYLGCDEDELISVGLGALRESFEKDFDSGREHVIPLSGGLDSRLVLAVLLEFTSARNIFTYTFGVPGTYDYDIGTRVAQHAGTRHVSFPLNGQSYDVGEVLAAAKRTCCQGVLFRHPPLWELDRQFPGARHWSGYVGDAVIGRHLPRQPSKTREDAKRLYLHHRKFVRSMKLDRCTDDDLLPYLEGGNLDPKVLSVDEQVLFDEAVAKFTEPLVLFKGYDFATPFINTPWMDFMFSVPDEHRLDARLFDQITQRTYPALFSLPTTQTFSLPPTAAVWKRRAKRTLNRARRIVHQFFPSVVYPHVQFDDFNEALRHNVSLKRLVREALTALNKRNIVDWIDIDAIWARHRARVRNHGDALISLASLELVLQARGE